MSEHLINFEHIEWEKLEKGLKQKVLASGNNKIRLVRVSHLFKEKKWCTNNHLGYVLRGKMNINFTGVIVEYQKGDIFSIHGGAKSKHKIIVEQGKSVELLIFECDCN